MNNTLPRLPIIIFVLFMFSCNADNQNIKEHIIIGQVENPKGKVYCGYLDKDEKMWFGTTDDGIYTYDDSTFIHFSEQDGLSNNKVSCIYQVENGDLWIGTADGISIFNGKTFTHLPLPEYHISTDWLKNSYPIVNPNEVQSIIQDDKGIFWIGTNGAGAYSYDGKTFTSHLSEVGNTMPDGLYHNIIQSISKDKQGNLWFASMSHGGVNKFNGKTFTQYMPKDGLSDDQIRTILSDRQGHMWFGFNGNRNSGLTYLDGNTFKTFSQQDGLCTKNIRALYEDSKGHIWIGGMQGLCVYDGKTFTQFKDNTGNTYERIVFIVGDKKGNIWFGGKHGFWKYNQKDVIDMTRK